jgi:Domain of unknown function (DUF1707)
MNEHGDGPPAIRASDADREQVAELVRRAVGDGRLTMVEGDERQALAYGATFRHELAPIVADLEPTPPGTTPGAAPTPSSATSPARADRPSTSTSFAVLGGAERTGEWTPGLTHVAVAVMGGTSLDLRRARLDDRGLTVRTVAVMGGMGVDLRGAVGPHGLAVVSIAFMGGTEIVVDPDTVVEMNGIGLMGGFADRSGPPTRPDGPRLHVTGFAMFGGVSVVRRPLTAGPITSR